MAQLCFSPLGIEDKKMEAVIKKISPFIDRIHWDVMDNTFVPFNGLPLEKLKDKYLDNIPIDVHLMVNDPYKYLDQLEKSENDIQYVIGQIEALDDPRNFIEDCRSRGFNAGLAINPETPITDVEPYINDTDAFLILGVNPGKSGQEIIKSTMDTLFFLRTERSDLTLIFDGGANPQNSQTLIAKGADFIVSGGFLQNTADPEMARRMMVGY